MSSHVTLRRHAASTGSQAASPNGALLMASHGEGASLDPRPDLVFPGMIHHRLISFIEVRPSVEGHELSAVCQSVPRTEHVVTPPGTRFMHVEVPKGGFRGMSSPLSLG